MDDSPKIRLISAVVADHAALFEQLRTTVEWDDRMAARRTASFGKPYNYSQIDYPEKAFPDSLLSLLELLDAILNIRFNNCLLNFYETGDNSMGFHSDDTTQLLPETGVAIISLGSIREITFRSKKDVEVQKSFPLTPGSLLYMDAEIQEDWLHAIKKQKNAGPRISLTWRAFA